MRARNIKPGFFKNDTLGELPYEARLLFVGLWCMADREGRLEDRPKRIKAEVFPYDRCDVGKLLDSLAGGGFISRYQIDGGAYIQIVNFLVHQMPHYKEAASVIPPMSGWTDSAYPGGAIPSDIREAVMERDGRTCQGCGATNDLSLDHIVPQSKGGQHTVDNLRVLCRSCNSAKSNRLASGNDEPTSAQPRAKVGSTESLDDSLIPDSLIPDSLIPDSLIPDTPKPGASTEDFEEFWEEYPNKKGKGEARKAYAKAVASTDPAVILGGLRKNLSDILAKEAKYRPYPSTWLNQERWLDEPVLVLRRVDDEAECPTITDDYFERTVG